MACPGKVWAERVEVMEQELAAIAQRMDLIRQELQAAAQHLSQQPPGAALQGS